MLKKLLYIALALGLCLSCKKEGGDTPGPAPDPPTPSEWTIGGKVTGSDGTSLSGVTVSDGFVCTQTDANGNYYLQSALTDADFVFVSTPSGYSAPVENALPVFYKRIDALTKTDGRYKDVNFTLQKINNPNRFTLFLSGDPQPRSSSAGFDKIGYHSLDCVDDMCKDFKETADPLLKSQPVYGIVLGDICHNDASLFTTYRSKMKNNGFPSYHVIGNHDHDLKKIGDKESATSFESVFGPSNYSFDLGNVHFVVIDNMMVTSEQRSSNSGTDLADAIRDDIWQWFSNDLQYVDRNKTLMICTHSPMFMRAGQKMASRGTVTLDGKKFSNHYADVDNLIKDFKKVYAWAGHTHTMYNYVDTSDPRVESHTVSRVTGELWTNEYEASGTPRGYVVLSYDNDRITWKFHPIKYQKGKHCMTKQPDYKYRDWNYVDGVAKMKADGTMDLDDSYQMHIYAPGTYAASDNTVYVNIFMWDELWKLPKFTFNGSTTTMTRYNKNNFCFYDMGCNEIQTWYKTNNSTLKDDSSGYSIDKTNCSTMFSAFVQSSGAGKKTGAVSVVDRFGNEYKQTITW